MRAGGAMRGGGMLGAAACCGAGWLTTGRATTLVSRRSTSSLPALSRPAS